MPYVCLWGWTQACMPLHHDYVFSEWICFIYGIASCWVLLLFRCTAIESTMRMLPSKLDIEVSLPWSTEGMMDPDEFKMTSIIAHGCNRPLDTGEVAPSSWMCQFMAEAYRVHWHIGAPAASPTLKTTSLSTRPFLRVNWAHSAAQASTMDGVILPLNVGILKNKGEVNKQFPSRHS